MRVETAGKGCGSRQPILPRPLPAPPGLRLLIPGLAQWSWRQPERAAILFGSFASALAMGLFAWGTWIGLGMLGFAFLAHVAASADAIRQSAFPGFGRWAPWMSAAGGLGVVCYGPALLLAGHLAMPVHQGGHAGGGYLVNGWAYATRPPSRGESVWLRASPWGEPRLGRVVAGPGQEVEWVDDELHVDGVPVPNGWPFRSARAPIDLQYKVPEGHVLVNPWSADERETSVGGLTVVPLEQVAGRAWIRFYPVSSRQLLD